MSEYDFYLASLRGEHPQWSEVPNSKLLGGGGPQVIRARHHSGLAAAIWRGEDGTMLAHLGEDMVDVASIWPQIADRAVPEDDYKARMKPHGVWPADNGADVLKEVAKVYAMEEAHGAVHGAIPMRSTTDEKTHGQPGHNSGATPSEFDQLREDAETRLQDAEKLLFTVGDAVKPGDVATATKLKDEATFIDSKLKPLEALRKAEKKPHDDAAAAVQAKFKPIIDKLDVAKRKLLMRVDAFTRAEDKRVREEHQKALAEAARKAAELQAASKSAEPIVVEAPPPPAPIKIGTIGDKRGVRKQKMRAEITDWAAAFADPLISDDPAVRAAAQKIADKLADINATKPWFKRVEA
jgi:hypothetical protein